MKKMHFVKENLLIQAKKRKEKSHLQIAMK